MCTISYSAALGFSLAWSSLAWSSSSASRSARLVAALNVDRFPEGPTQALYKKLIPPPPFLPFFFPLPPPFSGSGCFFFCAALPYFG